MREGVQLEEVEELDEPEEQSALARVIARLEHECAVLREREARREEADDRAEDDVRERVRWHGRVLDAVLACARREPHERLGHPALQAVEDLRREAKVVMPAPETVAVMQAADAFVGNRTSTDAFPPGTRSLVEAVLAWRKMRNAP